MSTPSTGETPKSRRKPGFPDLPKRKRYRSTGQGGWKIQDILAYWPNGMVLPWEIQPSARWSQFFCRMYPDPNVPRHEKSLYNAIYNGYLSCVFFENERAMKKRELEKDRVSAIPENYHGRVSGVSTLRIRG